MPRIGLMPEILGRLIELQAPCRLPWSVRRQGVHPQGLRPLQQPADRAGPVQKAVMAVAVQMDKGQRAHRGDLRVA